MDREQFALRKCVRVGAGINERDAGGGARQFDADAINR